MKCGKLCFKEIWKVVFVSFDFIDFIVEGCGYLEIIILSFKFFGVFVDKILISDNFIDFLFVSFGFNVKDILIVFELN